MQLTDYYCRLDDTTRRFVATTYVETMRQLHIHNHLALFPSNARDASVVVCWRIVSRFASGVRDRDELRAYAIAGLPPFIRQGFTTAVSIGTQRIRAAQLRFARRDYERKSLRLKQLGDCFGSSDDFAALATTVVGRANEDLSTTKAHYIRLLAQWSDKL